MNRCLLHLYALSFALMTAYDLALPNRSLSISEVQQVLALVAQEQWSREQAADWANVRWQLADREALTYVPPQAEKPLWEALLFLLGIDLQVNPGEYLHNTEDVLVYSGQFEQQVKHLV